MINFIEIHENGTEKMINLDWVEEVCSKDDKAIIYFAFQGADCINPDYVIADETYNQVKRMIIHLSV